MQVPIANIFFLFLDGVSSFNKILWRLEFKYSAPLPGTAEQEEARGMNCFIEKE
jgi:hypothetical protein